jgi:hypothetical protein
MMSLRSAIANSGSWTASSRGTVCATGTAIARDGLVILDGHPGGPDLCVPAMIRLERVGERVPEGARASDKQ